jgi:long-chain acyl-CoA synthetase
MLLDLTSVSPIRVDIASNHEGRAERMDQATQGDRGPDKVTGAGEPEAVPALLLPETLRKMAEVYPHEVAYSVVDDGAMTFADWDGQANRLARGLVAEGVTPGDRVALHVSMENALRWLVSYAAIHRAGGVAVPLNARLGEAEVSHMLKHCGARAGVADGELVSRDVAVLDVVIDATRGAPGAHGAGAGRGKVLSWATALDHDAGRMQVPRAEDDLADILYTSGTTGKPKGVAVRHVNASMMGPVPPNWSGGSWLHASPMTTFAGLAFVYNPMKLGLRCIYLPRFDAGRWMEVVEQERPVAVFLVPAMTHLLLDHPRFDDVDLSSVQLCTVGSAPLAPFVIERLQEKMPEAIVSNNYGMTEAGSVYCLTPKGEAVRRPGSVGQPAPPAEVKIVGPDGAALPTGDVGEVRLHIPGRPREYFGDPEATASTWVDGWLVTGDLGRVDEDGYLYIVGRSKDVIIRGGNNVHATDVEHVIVGHPAVKEAAVVGVPHPVLGEDVVGVVVLQPGAEVTGDELRQHCLRELADYKVPREWRFVDELPRNPTGKVVKPEVRRMLETPATG